MCYTSQLEGVRLDMHCLMAYWQSKYYIMVAPGWQLHVLQHGDEVARVEVNLCPLGLGILRWGGWDKI